MTHIHRPGRSRGRALAVLVGLVALAVPQAASANDSGPLLGPAGQAVNDILGLGGFFSDLNILPGNDVPATGGPSVLGQFEPPFVEPDIEGIPTTEKCISDQKGYKHCKPAAGTMNVLPDGRILYFDALEGTENNKFSIVAEGGTTFTNDQTRILDLSKRLWTHPDPLSGGANPSGAGSVQSDPLIPGLQSPETYNDGALFGSHQTYLPDGRLLVQGGTDYSADPGIPGTRFGVVELGGLKNTRIFDPKKNSFVETGDTHNGRWYPTMVPLGNGKIFEAGGVRKLIKPVYLNDPADSLQNVKQTEIYDPATGKWTVNPDSASRDLPLYPRLALLPDGKVFYDSEGQSFNPVGQSVNQVSWNVPAVYDPATHSWSAVSKLKIGQALTAFRGSAASTLLMLKPDASGAYTKANFLQAGGVLGLVAATSPGSYVSTRSSRIVAVDTSGGKDAYTMHTTGALNQPRWFGSQTLLPDGEVLMTSGANVDEVVGPGTERAVQQDELFDPATSKWRPVARQSDPRTYHNTAALLPSGEVLVGGHAPISTLYLNDTTLPGGFAPHDGRDPSFEIYKPPYLFRGPQPVIKKARHVIRYGKTFGIRTDVPADQIDKVELFRYTAITHLVDGGQRGVELPITGTKGKNLVLAAAPPNGDVAPPGPYMLFVVKKTDKGPVPSAAKTVMVKAG